MNIRLLARLAIAAAVLTSLPGFPEPQPGYDVLSVHKTKATFAGTRNHVCMGRTALCPDQCGHSGTLAVFSIDAYTTYEKKGEYGDEKATTFQFMVQDNRKNLKVPEDIKKTLDSLKPGDKVILEWEHRYMDKDGSRWPERPITTLKKSGDA